MTNASHPASDREALSALFDGELAGDAARFALKRLDHDQDWRATCERWQLAGDALRGQSHALLSPAFPSRVRAAMRADALPAVAAAAQSAAAPSLARRWGGAALVASAAVVALFLARMPVDGNAPAPQVAATMPSPVAPAPVAPPQPAPETGVAEFAAASVVATAGARVAAQRDRSPQRTRTASRPQRMASAPSPVTGEALVADATAADTAVVGVTTAVGGTSLVPGASATPFDANAARPWPRAVLPQYRNGGALAADYTAPSFYPFAPRAPDAAPSQPADAPADDRAQPAPPAP